ncbi:MAG: hypothetical protein U0939_06460 [Pirellulales bacterium]
MSLKRRQGLWSSWVVTVAVLATGCESEAPSVPKSVQADAAAKSTAKAAESNATADPHANLPDAPSADSRPSAAPDDSAPLDTAGGPLELDEVAFTAPAGWGRKPVQGGFVDAEYVLPKAEGDAAWGRLTISRAGGAIDANIDRWRGQFGGKPEKETRTEIDVAGVKAIVIDMSGEFADQRGPFAPPTKRAGYRMYAAILPIGAQNHFIKATGPEKTIASHVEALEAFVRSAKPKK